MWLPQERTNRGSRMADVLLAGKDWKFRALLRAQLIEEGFDVEAHETVGELGSAPVLPHPKTRFPKLLIADVSRSADPRKDLATLTGWSRHMPVWVIASRSIVRMDELQAGAFEAYLFRPVDVSDLVIRVKQRLSR
jgi:DNA-binding response OmpR family regulator